MWTKDKASELSVELMVGQSTLHGIGPACDPKHGLKRRVLWIVTLLAMCAIFTCSVALTILDYIRYDSYLSSKEYIAKELDFPDVSLCSSTIITRDAALILYTQQYIYETYGMDVLLEMYEEPMILTPLYDLLEISTLQVEDVFVWCAWQGVPFNCSTTFRPIISGTQFCHSLNPEAVVSGDYTLSVRGAGEKFGLTLILDTHVEKHVFTEISHTNFGAGFKIILHQPGTYPYSLDTSLMIGAGAEYHIGLQEKRIVRLSEPYSEEPCVRKDGPNDYGKCMALCETKLRYQNCPCWQIGIETCTYIEMPICYQTNIVNNRTDFCEHCIRNCRSTAYTTSMSSMAFPVAEYYEGVQAYTGLNRSYEEAKQNIAVVKTYFSTIQYTVTKQHKSYETTTLLANVGGLVGLTLGASLITLVELFEILVVASYKSFRHMMDRFKNRTTVTKVQPEKCVY